MNVYVGFHDQRNSSRILKPPGGGTSDIFGTNVKKVETAAKIIEETPQSPLKEIIEMPVEHVEDTTRKAEEVTTDCHDSKNGMNGDSESTKVEDLKVEELKINEEVKEENVIEEIVNKKEECKVESKVEITKTSKAKVATIGSILAQDDMEVQGFQKKNVKTPNRVPPGGYSSGLW
ncbi:unnamed protein product [Acanthoscelides obtectus]|uniref:Microtubule-associated protein Jupiter n=1 Tax=Acanthoscelides obtectus TaxID=200917 RepID=A0A9P0Q379_ACAOB|nr:unnamed protein product [Acanthoscelides obtectus]CAK1676072.1 hypothetical protein AOBTE_LOCUS30577 [Acanthoscelides obtectus]